MVSLRLPGLGVKMVLGENLLRSLVDIVDDFCPFSDYRACQGARPYLIFIILPAEAIKDFFCLAIGYVGN